ncbi:expression site-associated 9 (ESAG9) protein [Trypanosoma brucei equiperdum]|uniref:Expression site-associated 9 (ESAG9) protein n=1 Tax=Trypanosoma brucei equiperdum TaxID=630700 RepID=A0A3L6LCA1_9TRYP|nr:expression site-associated 9 (ESAG9) protein [Trypanosoma brucei equiperdum]
MSSITLQSASATAVSYGGGVCSEYRPSASGSVECGSLIPERGGPRGSTRLPPQPQKPSVSSKGTPHQGEKKEGPTVPTGNDVIRLTALTGLVSTTGVRGGKGGSAESAEDKSRVRSQSDSSPSLKEESYVSGYSGQKIGQTRQKLVSVERQSTESGNGVEEHARKRVLRDQTPGPDGGSVVQPPPRGVALRHEHGKIRGSQIVGG